MILLGPVAYSDRSVPESTLRTWHLGRSGSPRLANAVECLLVSSKWFASFNPGAFSRWCRCRCRCWSRRGLRGRCRGFRSRLWSWLWAGRRSRLGGRFRSRFRCRFRDGRRRFRRRRFRRRRGRLTSLLDFHKLIRKDVAYHDGHVFILDHAVRY